MELTVEALGLSKEELGERVIDRVVDLLLANYAIDDDGERVAVGSSAFGKMLEEKVMERANAAIEDIAGKNVLPNVATYVEDLCLQQTNQWGEKRGKTMTFTEYLVDRAESYLTEEVDYEGKTRAECRGFSFNKAQTRISYLVEKHLHYAISSAMKEAVKHANSAISQGIEQTVKIKLKEITDGLKVSVKV